MNILLLFLQVEPTSASLPYWAIVVLVGAVSGLFSLIVKLQADRVKDEIIQRKSLQEKLDLLNALREEEMKKTQKLLQENIQIIHYSMQKEREL